LKKEKIGQISGLSIYSEYKGIKIYLYAGRIAKKKPVVPVIKSMSDGNQ
jgi:hypothetical protein